MIWFANALLIACYLLLGRKHFRLGWALSIAGNSIYVILMLRINRFDLAFLPATFTLLAGYNLWLLRPKKSTS